MRRSLFAIREHDRITPPGCCRKNNRLIEAQRVGWQRLWESVCQGWVRSLLVVEGNLLVRIPLPLHGIPSSGFRVPEKPSLAPDQLEGGRPTQEAWSRSAA